MTPTPHFLAQPWAPAPALLAIAVAAAGLLGPAAAVANEPIPPKLVLTDKKPRPERPAAPPTSGAKAAAATNTAKAGTPLAADDPAGAEPVDPLEHLRQRLAERLSAGPGNANAGPYDVRISTRSTLPAAAPAKKAAAPAGRPAAAARPAKLNQGPGAGALHWGYQGDAGPAAWGSLKSEYTLCKTGERQSPIDIRGGLAVDLDPVVFNYQPSRFAVLDNGHTVQVNTAAGNSIDIGGRRFELQQFHFHRPSEERIDGRQFEMSLHLVHKDAQGRLAVVALLFDTGPPNAVVQEVWNNLPLERGEAQPARDPLELAGLLPNDRRYYTYMGSMTTPPCSEGVQWVVMRAPQSLTAEQIALFSRMYPMNARPVQQAAGRRILQSD